MRSFGHIFYKIFISLLLISMACPTSANASLSDKGYKELHVFSKVLHYVEDSYVEQANDEKLIQGAIKGLLSTLDPHSVYLPPHVFKELQLDTVGRFQGIGIEVGVRNKVLTVISPIKGSPAAKIGIKSGDKILAIDGHSTTGMDLAEAVSYIRGKKGTKIKLLIVRKGIKKPFEVKLTRTIIRVPSVAYEILDGKYGYISISSFQQGTTRSLEKALKYLRKHNALNGLILDLRQNPGGLLEQAISVSELFLNKGVIVTTSSRGKEIDRYVAHSDGTEPDFPMIVLVDEGTASASEIVAGALQDNGRAIVLGQPTFGKGSVQTVIELDDGGALKLTIARYYTPSGRSIQANGILPDIDVSETPPPTETKRRIREKDLEGHLEGLPETSKDKKLEIEDYQKKVALDYLKSWAIFGSKQAKTQLNNIKKEKGGK